jgi:hypothetical protein
MSKLISSYTSWQPLEEVIVGRVYTSEYFNHVKDSVVRGQMSRILDESNEDLENLSSVIKQYGAIVRRPDLPELKNWEFKINMTKSVPLPPLTPRDWQITMGDKLLRILNVPQMDSIVSIYSNQDTSCIIDPHASEFDPTHPLVHAVASCIVRVGTDVFFDNSEWMTDTHMQWIKNNVLDDRYRVHRARTNGHGDAVFAILKPGVIISSMHDTDIDYQDSFPGWEVYKIEEPTILAAMQVADFKHQSFNGRWYVQGIDTTGQFANYVDTYLSKWTGFVKETVFDVNCLVLDEHNVIFSSYNKNVFDFCKRHQIEPIICELRHKYFYDGGISCCTQDIRRRGGLETYL